ncbi:MAG TPA: polyhydroxyalkanoic acid system family protein [Polyangiales bacterium]|nr:polyhydroxyalkanoic acid system family protein [Polyangiales bacterium]
MDIEHKHSFAHDEAKARAKALADYLQNKHGMSVTWSGDDAFRLTGKYTVVGIDATVKILADKVHVTGPDPGMLWRSPAKAYITKKLVQYFDRQQPLDSLARA